MKDEVSGSAMYSRRKMLKWGACAAVASVLPWKIARADAPERKLGFYNIHTGESISRIYWVHGAYDPQALAEFNHVMRDHRTNEVAAVAPALLDALSSVRLALGSEAPLHLISGYRSAATNAQLASRSGQVAKHSLHLDGKAADIFLPGRSLDALHQAALQLQAGGVGYYPKSRFVHVDVGRVRRWRGA